MSNFELQAIGLLVIFLLFGFFIGWRWSRFFYKRLLEENDSYWKDELKKLACDRVDDGSFIGEQLAEKKVDKLALKASLKRELSRLKYLDEPLKKENLKLIQGVGLVVEETLNDLGVHSFSQIAAWKYDIIVKIDDYIDFSGRIEREKWVEQAKLLAKGEMSEFAKRVLSGEVPTSEDG